MLDITTLAAWGGFIGGIAVVVSLIYLAGQIRQNSRLLRSSTAGVTMEATNGVGGIVAQSPDLARIWWAGLADRSALSESDRQRFDPLVGMSFGVFDQEYDFFRDEVMSDRIWKRRRRTMGWTVQQAGMQQWWHAELRRDGLLLSPVAEANRLETSTGSFMDPGTHVR
jgi:hypothetical protein